MTNNDNDDSHIDKSCHSPEAVQTLYNALDERLVAFMKETPDVCMVCLVDVLAIFLAEVAVAAPNKESRNDVVKLFIEQYNSHLEALQEKFDEQPQRQPDDVQIGINHKRRLH